MFRRGSVRTTRIAPSGFCFGSVKVSPEIFYETGNGPAGSKKDFLPSDFVGRSYFNYFAPAVSDAFKNDSTLRVEKLRIVQLDKVFCLGCKHDLMMGMVETSS